MKVEKTFKAWHNIFQYNLQDIHTKKGILTTIDGDRCVYCDIETESLQLEHIIPISLGGTEDLHNHALACELCNLRKSQNTIADWKERESRLHPEIQKLAKRLEHLIDARNAGDGQTALNTLDLPKIKLDSVRGYEVRSRFGKMLLDGMHAKKITYGQFFHCFKQRGGAYLYERHFQGWVRGESIPKPKNFRLVIHVLDLDQLMDMHDIIEIYEAAATVRRQLVPLRRYTLDPRTLKSLSPEQKKEADRRKEVEKNLIVEKEDVHVHRSEITTYKILQRDKIGLPVFIEKTTRFPDGNYEVTYVRGIGG